MHAGKAKAEEEVEASATVSGGGPMEIVFSFDTTGSMYPCLTQVRCKVRSSVSSQLTVCYIENQKIM